MNELKDKIKYWEAQKEGYHESNIKYTNICMFIDDLKELSVNLVSKDKLYEAIKKKWQKRLKPIESNAITATAQQIEIYKRQQEIGEQRIITEILADLGEK